MKMTKQRNNNKARLIFENGIINVPEKTAEQKEADTKRFKAEQSRRTLHEL